MCCPQFCSLAVPMFMPADCSPPVFALLDDARPADDGAAPARSRLYDGPARTLELRAGDDAGVFFNALEDALAQGWHAVGLFSFELGYVLQRLPCAQPAGTPLATVLLFERCERLAPAEVDAWIAQRAAAEPFGVTQLQATLDDAGFAAAVAEIHQQIAAGDTYQVNFTFPLQFDMHGEPAALYAALRERQPVPYGALVALPDGQTVLSLSPELFVSHARGDLLCRPMKGTAAASGEPDIDAQRAQVLRNSDKERSENLMIVDLLRNDLGRIAITGSVEVPELFAIERFGAVLQMTSTIAARAREDIGLRQVFDALYPCG